MKTLLARTVAAGLLAGAAVLPGASAQALPGDTLDPLVWSNPQPGLTATVSLVRGTTSPRALRFVIRNTGAGWWNVGTFYSAFAAGTPDPVDSNGGLLGWVPPNGSLTEEFAVTARALPRVRIVPGLAVQVGLPRPLQTGLAGARLVSVSPITGGKRVVVELSNRTAVTRDVFAEVLLVRPGTRQGVAFLQQLTDNVLPVKPRSSVRVTTDLVSPRIAALGPVGLLLASIQAKPAFSAGLTATAPTATPDPLVGAVTSATVTSTRAAPANVELDVALTAPGGALVAVVKAFDRVPAGGSVPVTGSSGPLPAGTDVATLTATVVRLKVL